VWDIGCREERPTFAKIAPSGAVGVLGLKPVALSPADLAELPLDKGRGAVEVGEVMHGTPAEAAGVQKGDYVLGLAGKYLSDADPLNELDGLADGLERRKKAPLLLLRGTSRRTVPIEIP
jgi:S1-C subfamily serine protease